jgi:DNA-binding SARP family transcriptional activator
MTTEGARAEFGILGPLRVVVDGTEVQIATRRQRALLVLLLMNVGRVVPTERLIDQLWDGAPPPQGQVTLRSYVSNLRQALGGRDGLGGALTTRGPGYCLDVPPESVDALNLRLLAERGREHLRRGEVDAALAALDEAVQLWSGDPLSEIADHEVAQSTITQLTETYVGAAESRFEALLAAGRHLDAIPALEAFAADHPLREEPRALLMLALYRSGRAPEALEVHRRFRHLLQEELGIDPSARLDRLNERILRQDPELDAPVASSSTQAAAPVPAPATLVGRSRELAAGGSRLDALATTGAGSLLLIGGEPGIGKSTLLEALEADARDRGFAVHAGRAPAAAGAPAFWPWSQVVESIAATLDDEALVPATAGAARPVAQLSASVAERTGKPMPITGDNLQNLRFHLYEAVSAFIRQAGGTRPMVITLDDMHWADLPSLELLSYLTPTLEGRAVLLVVAYRDLPADRTDALADTLATVSREDAAEELALTGLGPEDVAALTQDLLGAAQSDPPARQRFATLLHERTGGNPFFVRQLARLMLESGPAAVDPAATPVPPGVRHVIASRLKAMPQSTQELLSAAAVVGRDFDLRTAAAVTDLSLEQALDAYDEAERHGLLESPDMASARRFVHALVQEVVVEQLPAGKAARLHAAVAARLAEDGGASPERLAEHLWVARDIVGADAVAAQLSAAEASVAVFAHERAEVYLRRALELTRTATPTDAQTELTVLLSLFRLITAVRGWGDEDVRAVVDRAMELTEAGGLTDDTARLWWSLFFYLLDRDDASYVDVVHTLAGTLDDPEGPGDGVGHAARATIHLGGVLADLHRDDRAAAYRQLEQARMHVEAAPSEALAAYDEHLHVMLLLIEGYWAALHEDIAAHRDAVGAAIALADADGRPFPRAVARTLGVATAPYLGDPASSRDLAASALEMAGRFGFGWLETLAGCFSAWAEAHAGGSADEAAELITRLLHQLTEAGRGGNLSLLNLLLADVRLVQGRPDEARSALLAARARPGPYRGLMVDLIDRRLDALP